MLQYFAMTILQLMRFNYCAFWQLI